MPSRASVGLAAREHRRGSRRGAPPSGGRRRASSTASGARAPPTPGPRSRRSRAASARAAGEQLVGRVDASHEPARPAPPRPRTRDRWPPTPSPAMIPTIRGRNQLEQASGTMPRRAKTKPILAPSAARRMSIGRVIVMPDAHGRAVDRGDHGLGALEDPQREHAAAVAGHVDRARPRAIARAACARQSKVSPPPLEVRARAEAAALARDDHGAHRVVGVGEVERLRSAPRASCACTRSAARAG